ncbi:Tuberous sclerosis 2-like protein [Didymosphaeria variabile]|uniref:Tuberous sclerosis 2-like protein n=1 Tax=Didymosphaeria variabile TaxID=1932322 RepID=A0A9W9C7K8_9PLEO|nr:Tuberous sclerosis 2-like protein [Didymosphaeria variabile]KAJ4348015.1 Tuberous sclerosis 2-like protein [Didymosphaeria variabile]
MSPPADDVPRTPDRRSSSAALFGAFRSLTSGRLKSPTPPPSASSTTYTPARSSSLAETLASPSTSADGSLKRISEQIVPKHARPVLGGPPELDGLVEQLDRAHPFAERAVAVDKICKIMEEYIIENVLDLWSRASDMLLPEQPDDVAESGYRLLRHCVGLPKLNALERNVLFDAACLRKTDRSFDKRLDIIAALTKGGRHVEACESSVTHFVLASFDAVYKQSVDAYKASRKSSGNKKSGEPVQELENLAQLFQYTIDICKFNSKVFSDDDLEHLLNKVVSICQETSRLPDIENAIRLFDTVITYVHIPSRSLRPLLEVLCAVHRQLDDLHKQTWNTLSNLFKSHVGQVAVNALLRTLNDGPVRKNRDSSAYRGTIQVLQQLLLENGRNGLPIVPMSLLFPALKASMQNPHKSQEEYVLDLIDAVLSDTSLKDLLLSEVDWTELLDIILTCAERGDQRLRGQSEKTLDDETPRSGSVSRNTVTNGAGSVVSNGDEAADVISNLDLAAPDPRVETMSRHSEDRVFKILSKLDGISGDLDFVQKDAVMDLFMRLAHRLSDSTAENVIQYYVDERYLHPSNGKWLEASRSMVSGIIKDSSRPRSLRILAIKALRETYNTVQVLCPSDLVLQCGTLLLNNIDNEEDVAVLNELVDFAVDVADRASWDHFPDIVELLKRRIQRTAVLHNSSDSIAHALSASFQLESDRALGTLCNVIATGFVRLFIRSVQHFPRKTRLLYETLRHIAGTDGYESDARLTVLRLLCRLRADSTHALYINPSSEGKSLAAVLCRTAETATTSATESHSGQTRHDDASPFREQRRVSGSPLPSTHKSVTRYSNAAGRVSKPVPPLWMYPGPKGLPEEPSSDVSRVVFSHINPEFYPLKDDILDMEITLWLELAISLLQKSPDWEVYSYVLVHLGPQLSNQSLVRSCIPQLKMLRNVICEQIRNSSFQEPPPHTLLKKADVAVCLFHILTVLISYHDYFEKSEEDDLVKVFIHGITNWDRTPKWCIHALSVCCLELPLSVSKSLDIVVQKVSQIVTKPATAIHILDLLTSLARMPELYKNFREDEFKMVFGVSFRYLQHIRDQRERAATSAALHNNHRSLRHSGPSREITSSPDAAAKQTKPVEDDLPQYLYSLAYHVIAFWFMGLKMEDRPKLMPWIARSLRFTDGMGRQTELEEQGQVIVDMMNLVCYSDRDETVAEDSFAKPGDGEVWKKSWIVGHSLVTIETAARTGVSQIINRRPCATRCLSVRPLLAPPPRHQIPLTVGLAAEAFDSSSYIGILPDDIFQTFYAALNSGNDPPIVLPDDDMIRRAIATFDRISAIDSYKVGVIYIGDGQTDERDIFMNDIGPPAYTSFLSDLGTLCRLKGAKFNTGGLDTRNDQDGEFTYCWRDRCIELVFHITTMMPTDRNDEMTYPNKKRHIGNDFVNIIYNDSGLPYNFDTFPSAFNYVHIVISPESRASFVDRRLDSDPEGKDRYYKVQVMTKPGFPNISPAAETKILAGKHLAAYCRLIAINACVFSAVWFIKDGGESVSSWRNRLREIQRLRERYGASDAHAITSPSSPNNQQLQQGLSSPPSRENNLAGQFKRTSVATYISEGTNRSSITSGSHDVAQ